MRGLRAARSAVVACALALAAAPGCGVLAHPPAEDLALLRDWMSGAFVARPSAGAVGEDALDLRLVMTPVWPSRWDGPWIYAEQALASNTAKPHSQRVYHLRSEPDGSLWADVFELPGDPKRFALAWRSAEPLGNLRPEDLVARPGCSLRIRAVTGRFLGASDEDACPSTLHGATTTASEITVEPDHVLFWERGLDASGRRVWGPSSPRRFAKTGSVRSAD